MVMPEDIRVVAANTLSWRGVDYKCAIGRGGFRADKQEGDGATPLGRFPLRRVFYRPDRVDQPATGLPVQAIRRDDGWCDASGHAAYNTHIKRPFAASHETMWRDDALYDVVVELGYNDAPVVAGRGSAIFFHVAQPDFSPTEGCVAVPRADLLRILAECSGTTSMDINPTRD